MAEKKEFRDIYHEKLQNPPRSLSIPPSESSTSYDLAAEKLKIPLTREYHQSHHEAYGHPGAGLQRPIRREHNRDIILSAADNERVFELIKDDAAIAELARKQNISPGAFKAHLLEVVEYNRKLYGQKGR